MAKQLNFYKTILFVMFSAFLATTFSSCSSDNDKSKSVKEDIVGDWTFKGGRAYFDKDGDFQMSFDGDDMNGTWKMDGDEWIIVDLSDGDKLYIQIISHSNGKISFKMFEDRDANGKGVDEIFSGSMDKVEENNSEKSELVGIWKVVEIIEYADKDYTIEIEKYGEEEYPSYCEFLSNGKVKEHYCEEDDGKYETNFWYYKFDKKNNEIIHIMGFAYEEIWKVRTLNSTTLVITWMDKDIDSYEKITFKRVPAVGK